MQVCGNEAIVCKCKYMCKCKCDDIFLLVLLYHQHDTSKYISQINWNYLNVSWFCMELPGCVMINLDRVKIGVVVYYSVKSSCKVLHEGGGGWVNIWAISAVW